MERNIYGAMSTNYKSFILAISLIFALSASISAAPGDLDPTFGIGGKRTDWAGYASGVAIQPDGKIVVVGNGIGCCSPGTNIDFRVARYNPDGSPDTTFGGGTGRVTTDFNGYHDASDNVVLQPDGKIIVAGWTVSQSPGEFSRVSLAVVRYNPDGSLDTTFGGGSGKVLTPLDYFGLGSTDVAIQPDGKILVVLFQFDLNDNDYGLLIRYNADGSPDTSFGMGSSVFGTGSVYSQLPIGSVVVQPADGKIVVNEGYLRNSPGIARYNTNGSLDTGFGSGGRVTLPGFELNSLAIDSAGKIVAAGGSGSESTFEFALLRFNVDGSPDSSFDGDGIVTTPSLQYANSIVIQSDGKIVAAGYRPGPGNYDLALARYNANGSLDNTFGGGDGITTVDFNNSSDFGAAVALDNQGRAVVVGGTGQVGGSSYMFAIARFLGDAPTCANPIDCAEFFVRQQYRDFLGREAEREGLQFYLNILNGCHPSDLECTLYTRGALSANFFRSPEFGRKGAYVANLFNIVIGQRPQTVAELSDSTKVDRPHYSEFITDLASVSTPNDDAILTEQKKDQLAVAWLGRSEVQAVLPGSLSNQQFVQKLETIAGVTLANESALIANLNGGSQTRAQVLRAVAESPEVTAKFYIPNFVTMEYFGFLRRDPEDCHNPANWNGSDPNQCGYIFHNSRFNTPGANPDLIENIIVRGFIESPEYRNRFGLN